MLRVDHMVLPIWDVEASLAFYSQTLELPLVEAFGGKDEDPWLLAAGCATPPRVAQVA